MALPATIAAAPGRAGGVDGVHLVRQPAEIGREDRCCDDDRV